MICNGYITTVKVIKKSKHSEKKNKKKCRYRILPLVYFFTHHVRNPLGCFIGFKRVNLHRISVNDITQCIGPTVLKRALALITNCSPWFEITCKVLTRMTYFYTPIFAALLFGVSDWQQNSKRDYELNSITFCEWGSDEKRSPLRCCLWDIIW